MIQIAPAFVLVLVVAIAVVGTARYRQYALRREIIDVPNWRSSHVTPTPRGGGVAVVMAAMLGFLVLGALGLASWRLVLVLGGGGAFVAVVGYVDDLGHIAARWRLAGHFAGAIFVLATLAGLPPLMGERSATFWWAAYPLAAVYLVWMLNLTNFMDGIDGITGVEVITVCVAGAVLHQTVTSAPPSLLPLVVAASALGFLFWNWPPAKIFMGDAGSGFLGVVLGGLSLEAGRDRPALFWSWTILLGVFIVDASVTLIRRIMRKERFYEAHCSHAYQHAAQRTSHRTVTLVVAAINVFWLFPLAYLVARQSLLPGVAIGVAYAPLIAVALWLRAGTDSQKPITKA